MRQQVHADDPMHKYFDIPPSGLPVIGAGADGRVARAVEQHSGYSDALKFVRDGCRELQVLKAIGTHQHVVELLKEYAPFGVRAEHVLVFPEMHGTLADLCRRGRRQQLVSYALAGRLAQQCLEGLAHIHGQRVVHRDLSPSNILVDMCPCADAGHQFTVKIADFSRARVLPAAGPTEQKAPEQQAMTTGVGCPCYVAPELLCCPWEGLHEYDVSVDVWAFAAIWFEVLSGARFMSGASEAKMAAAVVCRLGVCPASVRLGPRQTQIMEASRSHVTHLQKSVPPLSSYQVPGQVGWDVLAAALQWNPCCRPSAAALAKKPWVEVRQATPSPLPSSPLPRRSPCSDAGAWKFDTKKPPQTEVKGKCECAGHCYTPGHRYHKGCSCKVVVKGSKYCLLCKCSCLQCMRPKLRGLFCSMHSKIWAELPLQIQLLRAARRWLFWMIPCDITDFLQRFLGLRRHDALMFLAGLIKDDNDTM